MIKGAFYSLLAVVFIFGLTGCHSDSDNVSEETKNNHLSSQGPFDTSPVIDPEESLKKMQIEPGFAIKLVAAEPLINSPVAMSFDNKGRMWVVEMEGYMPDTLGTGEEKPNGKIVILDDKDKDGIIDDRKVFMDSLVMPRSICLIENGILVAEPPNLWFVDIDNDHPGKKILVDGRYTEGGNVEHQPNGLYRALDNWIYNAKSDKRYRKMGDHWLIERTHFRGQWGLSQDDQGRLFYNNNSENLLGDYFSPGSGASNTNQQDVRGFNENIVPDNKVYPSRPNKGVNRGYMEGTLDDSFRLVNFTAACGPLIYRGNLFGKEYYGNAFVAEPSANLIKRNIIEDQGYVVQGKQAYKGKEFLRSTDERFRPVSLYDGPDGALYIVDMYRGIIQHKTYLTDYLKSQIRSRSLTQPISYGRIYKIVPLQKERKWTSFPEDPMELVKLLESDNGWVRDKAQQILVDGKYLSVVPALRQYLTQTDRRLSAIHALWTLEGLGALTEGDLLPLLNQPDPTIRTQALNALHSAMNKRNYRLYLPVLRDLLNKKDTLAAPYIAFLAHTLQSFDKTEADGLLRIIMHQYPDNVFVSDAIISNYQDREAGALKQLEAFNSDTSLVLNKQLRKVLSDIKNSASKKNQAELGIGFPKGVALFTSVCQTCHGPQGNGIKSMAPPLNGSEWVNGDKDKLAAIVLFGLTGPVKVAGKLYKAPEINGDMPGIGNNDDLKDEDIAQLLSYIRKSWSNRAGVVEVADITRVRKKYKGRQKTFTMEELKKKN